MKIIDKTPLVNENGELGIVQRIQGMLQFGFNWPSELAAQKAIVTFFDKQLEKGYTLIRNLALGQSGITIPMILLGPAGIFVIQVTHLRGRYEARSDLWNVESGTGYKPAPVNLIQRTMRMARALQVYIERQGVKVPVSIEPVLIAADPGLHIESTRPAIRVMMIDGIRSFVSGLVTGRPVLSAEIVYDLTERILNPRLPQKESTQPPLSMPEPGISAVQEVPTQPKVSRARAIFDAAEEAKPFNPAEFDFAMTEEEPVEPEVVPAISPEGVPAVHLQKPQTKRRRILGMTVLQLVILAALALCLLAILVVAFVYVIPLVS
jgi:hypothetical protein